MKAPRVKNIIVHATCVALGAKGVLLLGDSGTAKSDLALRLIHEGWSLVADDRTVLTLTKGGIAAKAPTTLKGLLEVRGVGIVALPARPTRLALVVQLGREGRRLPEREIWTAPGQGKAPALPLIRLDGRHASDSAKISLALRAFSQGLFRDTFVTK